MRKRLLNLKDSSTYLLFGARGTGKSTLLKAELTGKNVLWIDLLSSHEEMRYFETPDLLSKQIEERGSELEWVVIDEVQKVPKLLDVVHREIEKSRCGIPLGNKQGLRFALSGSSARKLKRGGANLLAGRAFVYHLFPFTHNELGDDFIIDEALTYGTIPGILYYSSARERQEALNAYVDTYLKEEIFSEQLVRNIQPFRRFLNISAQVSGTIINFSKIAQDLRIDDKTVRTYFDIIEDTLIGSYLPAYEKSLRKQQSKSPKFYLFDCGVKRTLDPSLSDTTPYTSQQYSIAFEHFIINECLRLKSYRRQKMTLSHYNTGNAEIDLVVQKPGKVDSFIEIKSTNKVTHEHLAPLNRLSKDFPEFRYVCLSQDPIARKEGVIEVLPWRQGIEEVILWDE
jgi:uncharacterized protein